MHVFLGSCKMPLFEAPAKAYYVCGIPQFDAPYGNPYDFSETTSRFPETLQGGHLW